jgi:hypothetical protein
MREGGQIVTAALTKQLEQAVRGGTQADIAAAGAHELLRRGGNFHMTRWRAALAGSRWEARWRPARAHLGGRLIP